MPQDTIQIGTLVISKAIFDVLVPLISGLVGVLSGGLITYLTTRSIEDRKWRREITYKRQEEQREAIALVLEWIPPLQAALSKAMLMSTRYQMQGNDPAERMTQEEFMREYPHVLSELTKYDLPGRLRVLIPGAYDQSFQIIEGLNQLRSLSLSRMKTFEEAGKLVADLHTKLERFRHSMADAYLQTYSAK